ncbi:MAG: hypothetical protein AB7P52_12915 [Alphaproteobacteria bacterium]
MAPIKTIAIASVIAVISAAGASASADVCDPQDITVHQSGTDKAEGSFVVFGKITNKCAQPVGAQLEVVFRNAKGYAVDVDRFWPAGAHNIEPGDTFSFKRQTNADYQAASASVRVIDVERW